MATCEVSPNSKRSRRFMILTRRTIYLLSQFSTLLSTRYNTKQAQSKATLRIEVLYLLLAGRSIKGMAGSVLLR